MFRRDEFLELCLGTFYLGAVFLLFPLVFLDFLINLTNHGFLGGIVTARGGGHTEEAALSASVGVVVAWDCSCRRERQAGIYIVGE